MADIHDMDTEIEGRPMRDPMDPLVTRGYCGEHIEIATGVAAIRALVESQDKRGDRLEAYLRSIDEKQDEQGEHIVALRKDMEYHSKFWGAVAGAVTAAVGWLIGQVASK